MRNVEGLSSCVKIRQSVLSYTTKMNNTVRYIARNTQNVTLRSATLRNVCLNTFFSDQSNLMILLCYICNHFWSRMITKAAFETQQYALTSHFLIGPCINIFYNSRRFLNGPF